MSRPETLIYFFPGLTATYTKCWSHSAHWYKPVKSIMYVYTHSSYWCVLTTLHKAVCVHSKICTQFMVICLSLHLSSQEYVHQENGQCGDTDIWNIRLNHNSPSSVIGPGFTSTSPHLSNKVIMSARDITITTLLMGIRSLGCSNIMPNLLNLISSLSLKFGMQKARGY